MILFFLQDQLLDKLLPFCLLLLVLGFKLRVFLSQRVILTVNPLRNVGDQVKVVLDLRLLLLVLIAVFPSFHAFLLNMLFSPGHL